MTIYELERFLVSSGIWRADIKVRCGEVDIIVSKKNAYILKAIIKSIIPVSVYFRIIWSDKNWTKNRKKHTYQLTEKF